MNDLDIETLLREQLPRLADHATVPGDPNPALATVRAAPLPARDGKRARQIAVIALATALVAAGLVIVAATRTSHDAHRPLAPSGEPTGPAVHSLTIVAGNFHFDATHYDVPSGITELHLVSDEGSHTLVFDQPQFAYVQLAAPGGTTTTKVDFVEGHTYGIFDTIPGHQRAGEYATITVGPPDSAVHMVATTSTTGVVARP